ncbi:MAG: BRCT domain-containing protein [Alphaproteobacteria bacterium]
MPVVKFFYVPRKNEDGSVGVDFYVDKEAAQIACDIEEKAGRALPKNIPQSIELEFDNAGKLLSPDFTTQELRLKLIETALVVPPPVEINDAALPSEQFTRAARQAASAAQAPAPEADALSQISSVSGKVIAFAGKLTISRPRMKEYARSLGCTVASAVTENTDILVIGEDAGIKQERAQEYGTTVITEAQWIELARRCENKPKPAPGM